MMAASCAKQMDQAACLAILWHKGHLSQVLGRSAGRPAGGGHQRGGACGLPEMGPTLPALPHVRSSKTDVQQLQGEAKPC